MRPHGESSEVRLSPTNHESSVIRSQAAAEITTLTCAVCGKIGVSICAWCSKKPRYKTMMARAHPLQEREPELYKRLDEMARLPLQGNQQLWDEFCIEIKAGDFYEHLPILVEILQAGKWRTDALNVMPWLRQNLARRVKRSSAPEDYGPTGQRRIGGPKFDRRNGALTAFAIRPFAEFEMLSGDGDIISPDEVIEGRIARQDLQTAGGGDHYMATFPRPADRESLLLLGRKTYAEKCEGSYCSQMVYALKHDRPVFDKELARAITDQQALAKCLGLDRDEAEVLAVMSLLWDAGPRMYLKFLDGADQKRVRNAWDRLDRLRKQEAFHRTLRDIALRRRPERQGANLRTTSVPLQEEIAPNPPFRKEDYPEFRDIDERQERVRRNHFMQRFLDWLTATGVNAGAPTDRSQETHGVVDLPCDLAPKERLSYVAASSKGPSSAIQRKLYSE